MPNAFEMLIEQYRGQLDEQLNGMESTRTRALAALSVSGVVAGLFGPRLLADPNNFGRAVVVVFAVTTVAAVYVTLPHRLTLWSKSNSWLDWANEQYVAWQKEIETSGEANLGAYQLAARMATDMAAWRLENLPRLRRLQMVLAFTYLGLACQLVLWGLSVLVK